MDMSGTPTGDTAYTGAVCMSITVVGNTTYLPLSDPFCNTNACLAFEAAYTASQSEVSWTHQFDYGHYTTWYYLAVLGVAMASYALRLYRNCNPPSNDAVSSSTRSSVAQKCVAMLRAVTYRSVGGARVARWGMPQLGMLIFLLFTFLFFLLMTFLVHPYYRERRGYGSPPLAVRAGLMSTALTPIIVALAGKVNIVSWLTGITHEKLNTFHRWVSYLCLFLAIVHTVPFILIAVKNCGYSGLQAQFYKPGAYEYTGVPPLGMLVGLAVLSIPFIRHHFYNLFYRIHIPMYVAYLGLMFWHAGNEMDSWAYLWATLAVWLFSLLVRLFGKWQTFNIHRRWFSGWPATFQPLPGNMTRAVVLVPSDLRWKPGQHVFLRMLHLSSLQNHPYTIANLPSDKSKDGSEMQEMEFYIRANQGLTLDLMKSAEDVKDRSLPVHVDGPYGGLVEDVPALYQSLVFVAGGSGISACLPHILHAARRMREGNAMTRTIRLLWMVKQSEHTQWIMEELQKAVDMVDSSVLHLDFYITDGTAQHGSNGSMINGDRSDDNPDCDSGLKSGNLTTTTALQSLASIQNGRPFLPGLLPSLLTSRRVFVFGCGPESLRLDLGNAVAMAQGSVLKDRADMITLYTEKFGW